MHQVAAELRAGRTTFFVSSKPELRAPRKTGRIRDQVLALRSEERSVTDLAERGSRVATPVPGQSVWASWRAVDIKRLERAHTGPSRRIDPVKAAPFGDWPTGAVSDRNHAGLYPAFTSTPSPRGFPSTSTWTPPSPCAPTRPSLSTPTTPNLTHPSAGGADAPSASASRRAEPRRNCLDLPSRGSRLTEALSQFREADHK